MGVFSENAIIGASAAGGYDIDQSLKYEDGDSPYLSWTSSATPTDSTKATLSCWFKLGPGANFSTDMTTWTFRTIVGWGHSTDGRTSIGLHDQSVNGGLPCIAIKSTDSGGSMYFNYLSNAVIRDFSAWYNLVVVWDGSIGTAVNRIKAYLNGTELTWSTSSNSQSDFYISGRGMPVATVGANYGGSYQGHWDGYIAETHWVDGQALTPGDFAETNADTNQWVPIKYAGSYGTNGFYLDFSNSGSLGTDGSGNGNNFTSTNLASTDQVLDSPTNNFATINALTESANNRNDFHEGNLRATANDISGNSSAWFTATMGIPPNTGKWYWEFADEIYIDAGSFGGSYPDGWGMGLLADDGHAKLFADNDISNTGWWFSKSNNNVGTARARGGSTSSENKRVPSTSTGVFKCCYDSDAGSFWFGGDLGWMTKTSTGTPETSDQPGSGNDLWDSGTGVGFSGYTVIPAWATINAGGNLTQLRFNFGQDSTFAGIRSGVSGTAGNPSGGGYGGNTDSEGYGDFFYEVPTGFKALCTKNLPDPSIAVPADHFNTVLYTGNGSNPRSITGVGFQPDFHWRKKRNAARSHNLHDVVRGAANFLYMDATVAEVSTDGNGTLSSFDSDGFTFNSEAGDENTNNSGDTYVTWNWKAGGTASSNTDGSITSSVSANTTAGFSIVGWTGTGSNVTVGHGLSQAPDLIINKTRSTSGVTSQWVAQSILWQSATDTNLLYLNGTNGASDDTNVFQAAPTATVFSPQGGGWSGIGVSGENYIAYCFHSVAGYSKVAYYKGNGNQNGSFVYTGFRPAFIFIKRVTNSGSNSYIVDNKRIGYNHFVYLTDAGSNKYLWPDSSAAEGNGNTTKGIGMDIVSNGFKFRTSGGDYNASSNDYLFYAIAESPFKTANAR